MSRHPQKPRLAWALTGSGHFFTECMDLMHEIGELDVFVSKAGAEVVRMYKHDLAMLPEPARVFRDTTASAAPGPIQATRRPYRSPSTEQLISVPGHSLSLSRRIQRSPSKRSNLRREVTAKTSSGFVSAPSAQTWVLVMLDVRDGAGKNPRSG